MSNLNVLITLNYKISLKFTDSCLVSKINFFNKVDHSLIIFKTLQTFFNQNIFYFQSWWLIFCQQAINQNFELIWNLWLIMNLPKYFRITLIKEFVVRFIISFNKFQFPKYHIEKNTAGCKNIIWGLCSFNFWSKKRQTNDSIFWP